MKINLSCNEDSANTLWNCQADIVMQLSYFDTKSEARKKLETIFEKKLFDSKNKKFEESMDQWAEIFNEKRELEGTIEVTANLKITKVQGYRKRKMFDYSTDHHRYFDGILLVENKKIHVNKKIMSMSSTFFENIFFCNFKEKEAKFVEIPGVSYDEFMIFLDFIHPTGRQIESGFLENMMVLADLFMTDCVMNSCEEFLIKTDKVDMAKKLILAERFSLCELMVSWKSFIKIVQAHFLRITVSIASKRFEISCRLQN